MSGCHHGGLELDRLGKPCSTRLSSHSLYAAVGSGESARSTSASSWSSRVTGSASVAMPASSASSMAVSTSVCVMAGLSQLRDGAVQAGAHVRLRHAEHARDLRIREPARELQRDQVALPAVERCERRAHDLAPYRHI